MFKCEPCVIIQFSAICSIYLQGYLYPYGIQGHILGMLRAQNWLNAFIFLIWPFLNLSYPFGFSAEWKKSTLALLTALALMCLQPSSETELWESDLSAVILHSTMKFSQNWGTSDGSEGLVLLFNRSSCWCWLTLSTWSELDHSQSRCCWRLNCNCHIHHPWTAVTLQQRKKMHMLLFFYLV